LIEVLTNGSQGGSEDHDHTFEWLEKATPAVGAFKPLHTDPHYIDLLRRMGVKTPSMSAQIRIRSIGMSLVLENMKSPARDL
jgi:hypothetical protein